MLVLISYDISTLSKDGSTRLRKVAKRCQDFGQRVQNSVFECNLQYNQFIKLKNELLDLADLSQDSLRFYLLGNNWQPKVEHFGAKSSYNPEGILII